MILALALAEPGTGVMGSEGDEIGISLYVCSYKGKRDLTNTHSE